MTAHPTRTPRTRSVAALATALVAGALLVPPASGQELASPPDDWLLGVCTAITRLNEVQPNLIGLGDAARVGDTDAMEVEAISAGLVGDAAQTALEAITSDYPEGDPLASSLSDASLALVELGATLIEADPTDPAPVRAALAAVVDTYDRLGAVQAELGGLQSIATVDCSGVPVPTMVSLPGVSPEPGATELPPLVGDPELEALFPPTIGGQPIQVESITGPEILERVDPDVPSGAAFIDQLGGFLAEHGYGTEDLSLASTSAALGDGTFVGLTAIRVRGADGAALMDGLASLITRDYVDPQREIVTVGDREALRVSDGPYDPEGIYEVFVPMGEVVWAISAVDPLLTEILETLGSP